MTGIFDAVRRISARDAAERAGLSLQLRGGKAWACCPLHGEKTPSLRLYDEPERGWYCFGCHAGGDAVRLYQGLYHLEPLAAARALASAFGIPTDGPAQKPAPTVWNLRRALERWRAERLAELREARALADGVCRCRVAIGGPDAWADRNFTGALSALAAADIEIEQTEGATLDELAAMMERGTTG